MKYKMVCYKLILLSTHTARLSSYKDIIFSLTYPNSKLLFEVKK